LDDIARGQGIKKDELLTEIENIVNSGTKLNLSRYVNEVTEEEILEEVMDFFKRTNENVMEAAMKEYGEEFTKDDLHLMHIHFVSEMAN
jgi:ATP-dependent DNA helicase RecQ